MGRRDKPEAREYRFPEKFQDMSGMYLLLVQLISIKGTM